MRGIIHGCSVPPCLAGNFTPKGFEVKHPQLALKKPLSPGRSLCLMPCSATLSCEPTINRVHIPCWGEQQSPSKVSQHRIAAVPIVGISIIERYTKNHDNEGA